MLSQTARVTIERPARYGKQLASHLGNKIQLEEVASGYKLTFELGVATISPTTEILIMVAESDTNEGLERIKFVLDKHLRQFTTKLPEFEIIWQ